MKLVRLPLKYTREGGKISEVIFIFVSTRYFKKISKQLKLWHPKIMLPNLKKVSFSVKTKYEEKVSPIYFFTGCLNMGRPFKIPSDIFPPLHSVGFFS